MGQEVIGVCGSPDLIKILTSLGFTVVGSHDFTEAQRLVREAQGSGSFPIVVVDGDDTGRSVRWTESQSRRTDVIIIPGPAGKFGGHPLAASLPMSIQDLLDELAMPPVLGAGLEEQIGFGGVIGGSTAPQPQHGDIEPQQQAQQPRAVEPQQQAQQPRAVEPQQQASATQQPAEQLQASQSPSPEIPASVPSQRGHGAGPPPSPDPLAWLNAAQPQAPQEQKPDPFASTPPTQQAPAAPQPSPGQAPLSSQQPPVQRNDAPHQQHFPPTNAPPFDAVVRQPQSPFDQPQQQQGGFSHSPAQQNPLFQSSQPVQQPSPGMSVTDYFDSRSPVAQNVFQSRAAGNVLISWAAKGGVGKTSISIISSQMAGLAGLRVALVDANRGQADLRQYLKIENQPFPTIYDAQARGWESAVIEASHVSEVRADRGSVAFDLVQGPFGHLADPKDTPASLYSDVVNELKKHYDLVVVDTQIVEKHYTDIWAEFLIPEIRSGAWSLGLFDQSPTGLPNLHASMQKMVSELGLSPSRMMVAANRWNDFEEADTDWMRHHFTGLGTLIGSADKDPDFENAVLGGFLPVEGTSVTPLVKAALFKITGNQVFVATDPNQKMTRRERRAARKASKMR